VDEGKKRLGGKKEKKGQFLHSPSKKGEKLYGTVSTVRIRLKKA